MAPLQNSLCKSWPWGATFHLQEAALVSMLLGQDPLRRKTFPLRNVRDDDPFEFAFRAETRFANLPII